MEFERLAAAVTLDDIVNAAEEATAEAEVSNRLRRQILGRLRRRQTLSLSLKQLMFTYKVDFEALKDPEHRRPRAGTDEIAAAVRENAT